MSDLFRINFHKMTVPIRTERLTRDTNIRLCATTITISAVISRIPQFHEQECSIVQFHPVIRAALKNTWRTATVRAALQDGLPFRFEEYRSKCLGHFQSKPKPDGWMSIESRPQRWTTANASVTQTHRERVRPAPHTRGGVLLAALRSKPFDRFYIMNSPACVYRLPADYRIADASQPGN